jgi:Domain of unknown function (DUF1707)
VVPLVGETQRDRAVRRLQRAYTEAYLETPELDRRLELALRARTAAQLGLSVRGIPGAIGELVVQGIAVPAVRLGTFGVRLWVARVLLRMALGGWVLATAVLGTIAGVALLTAGLSAGLGIALALVWLVSTGAAYGIARSARRLSRP